jgi:hypothetical protein
MDPNDISKFSKLDGIEVATATPSSDFINNVKANVKRKLPSVKELSGFAQVKGHHLPIALVGGGPSVKKELEKIKDFASNFPIIACGSSHDYLVSNGIIPDYCTLCDPDPITAAYIKKHNNKTKYLTALSCDALVYEVLKDRQVYTWNCRSDEAAEHIKDDIQGHVDILGGCTVGLRSISIAMCFGYTNIHFWGFDSCMGEDDLHHAYEFETDKEEIGVTYPVRFGEISNDKPDSDGKYYICSGYQLAQAVHFQQFLQTYGAAFTPTFHGEGMLADYVAYLRIKSETMKLNNTETKQDMIQAA